MVVSVWVDFCVNNSYIKEVLCINKAKPALNCNGKCYLATKLKKESQQNKTEKQALLSKVNVMPVFFVSFQEIKFNRIKNPIKRIGSYYTNHYNLLLHNKKDRPPIYA